MGYLLIKMFYGHAMFIGGNSSAGFIAVASRGYKNGLQFEQDYSHSVFNFYFFGKIIRRQMSWHVLKLDLNSARWMPKLASMRRSELCGLDVTARYHWSVARQLVYGATQLTCRPFWIIAWTLISSLQNKKNCTSQVYALVYTNRTGYTSLLAIL